VRAQLESGGLNQSGETGPIRNGRSLPAAEDFRTNRQMQFVHQPGPEHRVVEFAATFADQAAHAPASAQPLQGGPQIGVLPAKYGHLVGDGPQPLQAGARGTARGEDDDG